MDTARPDLSFVLPAHSEAPNVAVLAAALAKIAAALGSHEIVFVDDGSTDGTLAEIKTLAARDEAVRYVAFTRNGSNPGHPATDAQGARAAASADA